MVVAFRKQAKLEMEEGWVGAVPIPEGDDVDINEVKDAVVAFALNQIENSALEPLQHLVVKDGYSKGQLKGHLFPDVLPAFKKWTAEGKKIYMYTAGLELLQNCLISKSVEGDITELISGCFNSSEFPRTKSESFREMCKKVECAADKVAFLTDDAPTARAARKAGMVVIMLCREGNSYVGNCIRESFPVITSFEDISQQICSKRKKPSDETDISGGKRAKLEDSVANPEVKVEEKCEDKGKKDVSSESKPEKNIKAPEHSEEKVKVKEDEKVVSKTEVKEDEEKMDVDGDINAEETVTKTEGKSAKVKIVVIPPEEEAKKEKVSEEKMGEKQEKIDGAEEKVEKTEVNEEKVKKTELNEEKVKKTEVNEEKVKKTEVNEEKVKKTEVNEEKVKKTEINEEKAKKTEVNEEKAKKTEVNEEKVEKTEVNEEKTVKKVEGEKEIKKDVKIKAENSQSKDLEGEKTDDKKTERTDSKVEEKETKDGASKEKMIEEEPKAEDKAAGDKVKVEKESSEKNGSEEASTVENGDVISEKKTVSSDAVTENGDAEKDEVQANGVNHENGEGKVDGENGVLEGGKTESATKEAVKAVTKKTELEEPVPDAAPAQESA